MAGQIIHSAAVIKQLTNKCKRTNKNYFCISELCDHTTDYTVRNSCVALFIPVARKLDSQHLETMRRPIKCNMDLYM